jgi:hypothetical protein
MPHAIDWPTMADLTFAQWRAAGAESIWPVPFDAEIKAASRMPGRMSMTTLVLVRPARPGARNVAVTD